MSEPLVPGWLTPASDPSALDPALWPDDTTRGAAGELEIGGVPVTQLGADFGLPLYVVDRATAVSQARAILTAFTDAFGHYGASVTCYYAGKAFLATAFVRWMLAEGLNIDVSTAGELAFALAAGAPPERIGFHGNNKSDREIEEAVTRGVGTIILDSADEADRVAREAARRGVVQRVRLRVTTGVHAHTHEYLSTAVEDQKFGVALADVEGAVSRIRALPALEFRGMHSHIGSQIFEPAAYAEAIDRLMSLQARLLEGGDVPELNLGGGFGIAYTSADEPVPVADMATAIADAVADAADRYDIPIPEIVIEPGRAIAGRAGVTLYEVGAVKHVVVNAEGDVRTYVAVDGGMSDNVRPALYGADYTAVLASRAPSAQQAVSRAVGKHCESGDIVVRDVYLPADVHRGDVLAVPVTGAYAFSLSSNYNMVPRPAVVAIGDGAPRVMVRRETVETLLARDVDAR